MADFRQIMETHWRERGQQGGVNIATMLGNKPEDITSAMVEIDSKEVPELFKSYFKDPKTMKVLELGAGVGRFTGILANTFKEVISTDFIEEFLSKNKEVSSSLYPNISYQVLDAAKMSYPPDSFDLIFSYWLLMYLDDKEVQQFANNSLKMLQPGGYVMFRESHLHRNINVATPKGYPTRYRRLVEYHKMFLDAHYTDSDNQEYVFEFILGQSSEAYQQIYGNLAEVYWIWQKRKVGDTPTRNLQVWDCEGDEGEHCSDDTTGDSKHEEGHHDDHESDSYPGEGFLTPGGLQVHKDVLARVNIQPGNRVVDVGSGSGGAMKYISKELGAFVTGVECMVEEVEKSIKLLHKLGLRRENIVIGDVKLIKLPDATYDVVCAREFMQCAPDRAEYCAQFLRWLKPGGQVVVAGFFVGKDCKEAHDFVKGFGWPPIPTPAVFAEMLEKTGFIDIKMEDYTKDYCRIVNEQLANAKGISEADMKMWESFSSNFEEKLLSGIMTWPIITARKP